MTTLDHEKLIAKLRRLSTIEFGGAAAQMAVEAMREAADALSSLPAQGGDDRRQKYADRIAKIHGRDLDLCFGMGEFAAGVTDEQKRAAMMVFFFPNTSPAPSHPAAVAVTDEMVERACKSHAPQWPGIDAEIKVYARQQMRDALNAALRSTP